MSNRLRKLSTGFTQVPNALLRDTRLSLRAKGLYALLFSKPDDWLYIEEVLVKESTEGRDAFRTATAELIAVGWLIKRQVRAEKGLLSHTEWLLTVDCKSGDGSTGDGSSVAGQSASIKTETSKTDEVTPSLPHAVSKSSGRLGLPMAERSTARGVSGLGSPMGSTPRRMKSSLRSKPSKPHGTGGRTMAPMCQCL